MWSNLRSGRRNPFPKPYQYKNPYRSRKIEPYKDEEERIDELLTGFVAGKPATRPEELFARALRAKNKEFSFQVKILVPMALPGQEYSIDFVVGEEPIEIDGSWVHKSAAARANDDLRDQILSNYLQDYGLLPIKRIKVDQEWGYDIYESLVDENL